MTSKSYVIGGDCSTSGSKAMAMTFNGEVLDVVFVPHAHVETDQKGIKEINPFELRRSASSAVSQLVKKITLKGYTDCKGVAFAGAMHGLVLINAKGECGPNVVCWNDERGEAHGLRWSDELQLPIPLRFTGARYDDWMSRSDGSFVPKRVLTPSSYITSLACGGKTGMLPCEASGMYGFQRNPLAPDWTAIRRASPSFPEMVPKVYPFGAMVGRTDKAGSDLFGIPIGTPWAAGGADQMTGCVGSGVVRPGVAKLELGTSMVLNVSGIELIKNHRGLIDAMNSSLGLTHSMCCVTNGMFGYERFVKYVHSIRGGNESDVYSYLSELARAVEPGARGLTVLPFFTSEASLLQPEGSSASLLNLSAANFNIACQARAFMEAPLLILLEALSKMDPSGKIHSIVLAGGGAKDSFLPQLVADMSGLDTYVSTHTESVARGAAINAAKMVLQLGGELESHDSYILRFSERGNVIRPTAGQKEIYTGLRGQFLATEKLLRPVVFRA